MGNDKDPCNVRECLSESVNVLRQLEESTLATEADQALGKFEEIAITGVTNLRGAPMTLREPNGLEHLMQRIAARLSREQQYHLLASKMREARSCLLVSRTNLQA